MEALQKGNAPELQFVDIKLCSGPAVEEGDTVLLLYRCALTEEALTNGPLIESNYGSDVPIEVRVQDGILLPGVYRALIGMHSGGSIRRVRIPASLAYADRGSALIPPGNEVWVDLCVSRVALTA